MASEAERYCVGLWNSAVSILACDVLGLSIERGVVNTDSLQEYLIRVGQVQSMLCRATFLLWPIAGRRLCRAPIRIRPPGLQDRIAVLQEMQSHGTHFPSPTVFADASHKDDRLQQKNR